MDGTIIISYFDASNNILADYTMYSIHIDDDFNFKSIPCQCEILMHNPIQLYDHNPTLDNQSISSRCVYCSDGDPLIIRERILIHISGGLDSIRIFKRHFLSVLKISKTFVFFLRRSSNFLTRYGSRIKDPLWKRTLSIFLWIFTWRS